MKTKSTKNYALFISDKLNRVITEKDAGPMKKLRDSMRTYGFFPWSPILVFRSGEKLKVLDGQHRITVAQELGLPVFYFETDRSDIVIADVANTQCPWQLRHYIESFAAQGKKAYQELLTFALERGLPLSRAATLLDGQVGNCGNTATRIKDGSFEVRDREFADRVADIVQVLYAIVPWAISTGAVAAISRFVRVPDFDDLQFISKAKTHPHLLHKQPALEMYSEMFENIYNYAARARIPISFMAKEAAAGRSVAATKKGRAA